MANRDRGQSGGFYATLAELTSNAGRFISEGDLLFITSNGDCYQATATVNGLPISGTSPQLYAELRSGANLNINWDFEVTFNDGLELQSGYGTRNVHGNKAVDFSRASASGNINKSGVIEAVGVDEPRIVSKGLSIYGSYINYFATPQAPATQTVTIPSGTYTLWVIGSGSASTTYGTATDSSELTFTSPGESLTVTISGALSLCNLIDLHRIAPPIIDASAPSSSSPDVTSVPVMSNMPAPGEPFTDMYDFVYNGNLGFICETTSFGYGVFVDSSGNVACRGLSQSAVICSGLVVGGKYRLAVSFDGTNVTGYIDGVKQSTGQIDISYDLNSIIYLGRSQVGDYLNSTIKNNRRKFSNGALSDSQIAALGGAE